MSQLTTCDHVNSHKISLLPLRVSVRTAVSHIICCKKHYLNLVHQLLLIRTKMKHISFWFQFPCGDSRNTQRVINEVNWCWEIKTAGEDEYANEWNLSSVNSRCWSWFSGFSCSLKQKKTTNIQSGVPVLSLLFWQITSPSAAEWGTWPAKYLNGK